MILMSNSGVTRFAIFKLESLQSGKNVSVRCKALTDIASTVLVVGVFLPFISTGQLQMANPRIEAGVGLLGFAIWRVILSQNGKTIFSRQIIVELEPGTLVDYRNEIWCIGRLWS